MGNNILTAIFARDRNQFLFNVAMNASESIKALMSLDRESSIGIEFTRNIFTHVLPNDPKSPSIYWLEDDQYVILYPPYSTPYAHKFTEKCKFIEVLSGVIFDKNSDLKLFKGEKIKISPSDNYMPYTLEKSAYLRVCISECSSILDQICR